MSKIPFWARKPVHKSEVIATPRGWVAVDTGEMLKVVHNLTAKLESLNLLQDLPKTEEKIEEALVEKEQEVVVEPEAEETQVELPVAEEEQPVVEEKPKRRGRKPKSE